MANTSLASDEKAKAESLRDQLHDIAARLAGVESSIRSVMENASIDVDSGNILNMLADVVRQTNEEVGECGSRVGQLKAG